MKGKISIGKVTCGGRPIEKDYVRIEIEDELSSIHFVEVKVELRAFAEALFGLGNVPVEFELRGLDRVGKKFERKTVVVSILVNSLEIPNLSDDNIDKAVSAYEIDGWIGRREDCCNHHNYVNCTKTHEMYRVHFYRWVDVEEE